MDGDTFIVCHRGISKTSPCQFIPAMLAIISRFKRIFRWGLKWMDLRLPPAARPPFPRMFLIIARETMTREIKIAPSRKYRRGRGPRSIEKRFFRVESFLLEKKMVTFRLNFRQWKYYPNRKLFGRVIILWTVTKILFPNYPLELFFYSKNRTRFSFPPRITNCVFHSCVKRVESFVRDFVIARSIIFFRGGGE